MISLPQTIVDYPGTCICLGSHVRYMLFINFASSDSLSDLRSYVQSLLLPYKDTCLNGY